MVKKCPRAMIKVPLSSSSRWSRWDKVVAAHYSGMIDNRRLAARQAVIVRDMIDMLPLEHDIRRSIGTITCG